MVSEIANQDFIASSNFQSGRLETTFKIGLRKTRVPVQGSAQKFPWVVWDPFQVRLHEPGVGESREIDHQNGSSLPADSSRFDESFGHVWNFVKDAFE